MVVSPSARMPRNAGPNWGFAFLQNAERMIPGPLFRPLVGLGVAVAVACMPAPRRQSRDYLATVLGRPPHIWEIWRHFERYTDFLILKLRVARGVAHGGALDPAHAGGFEDLMRTGQPALFGTFHFGRSDLLGFLLGAHFRRKVAMIRMKVANGVETAQLGRLFGRWVSFIWVNRPQDLLFAIKDAVESGGSLALQCDRMEFTAKVEAFDFLGARRQFPFTIYHLSLLFNRPVVFCLGLPGGTRDQTVIQASPAYLPDPSLGRDANLRRARDHFQAVLSNLETLVREHPHLWFNFIPLNPVAPPPPAISAHRPSHVVLMPTYNTGPRLAGVVAEVLRHWQPVLVVVDGSTDGSDEPLLEMARRGPGLSILRLPSNRGKGAAVLAGLAGAAGRGHTHALVMDADGQHPAACIAAFMGQSLRHPAAMILGRPVFGADVPLERLYCRRISVGITRIETLGAAVADPLFGFRVYPVQPLLAALSPRRTGRRYDFDTEAAVRLFWAGVEPINLAAPVRYFTRAEGGVSHYHYLRDNTTQVLMHARLVLELIVRHWPAVLRNRRRWPGLGRDAAPRTANAVFQ